MNILVFILILTLSFTLYAKAETSVKSKTEAVVTSEGFGQNKILRKIANATNDAIDIISQLGQTTNKPRPTPQVLGSFFGNTDSSSGALVRKPANKKSAGKPTK